MPLKNIRLKDFCSLSLSLCREMFEPKIADYKNGKYDSDGLITEIKEQTPNFQPYSKGKDFADEEGY